MRARDTPSGRARLRLARMAGLAGAYTVRFLRANVDVIREILSPGDGLSPAIVEVLLRSRTPFEISSFVGLISLTPGTVALALSEDRSRLTVHGMHAGDPATFRADLAELEERMLAAFRPVPLPPSPAGGAGRPTSRRTT